METRLSIWLTGGKRDVLDIKPNLLSILVGVNDSVFRDKVESVEQFETTYDKLLADTHSALPETRVVLCEPFLLPVGNTHGWPALDHKDVYESERTKMKKYEEAVARLAAKYHLPEVMFQKAFDDACQKAPADHWAWDGIHPTYAGHGLMADEWRKNGGAARMTLPHCCVMDLHPHHDRAGARAGEHPQHPPANPRPSNCRMDHCGRRWLSPVDTKPTRAMGAARSC